MISLISSFFSYLKTCAWPIKPHERKKLIPMLMMICLIVFCYDLLRNMKDAIAITASGAEIIPFIKVWALLPGALLLTYVFTKLSNHYSQERVFYIMISGFLIFFALFAFILYPLRHSLHPHGLADSLENVLPLGFKGLVSMFRNWSFTLFYVACELWGSIVMTVIFWGFANEVTKIDEAHRFFGVFCLGANCCAIMAGEAGLFIPNEYAATDLIREEWGLPLMILCSLVILCGMAVMGIFRWMNQNVLNDPAFDELHKTKKEFKAKGKLSMKESFSYLSNSKYLICIAVLVVAYNLVINLVEVVWKDQLRRLYPSPDDYFKFMSYLTVTIGIVSAVMSLFMSRIIDRIGWTGTALLTPIIMVVTSIGFFGFIFYRSYVGENVLLFLGATPLYLAVMFGAAQNCLSKAMKYSVFDGTKEMAFIPLSHECKLRGKAAIDGVGSRLGKSGGSVIHTALLMVFGSLSASSAYVAVILLVVIAVWIIAAKSLGKQFGALVDGPKESEEPLITGEAVPAATT